MTAPSAEVDLVVVGAGVAGLVIAHDAARAGLRVTVLEAAAAAGGLLRRAVLDGIPIDVGAESFATRTSGVADLIVDAGLDLRIVDPAPFGAHLAVAGASDNAASIIRAPLPQATVLGIPADPLADDVVRILGADGARRARAEIAVPADPEPSLADLVTAACGPLLTERLVDPLCRSVYSVPAADARLSRLHPALWREFRARGSLIEAAGAAAAPHRPGSGVAGISGGMWRLADALLAVALAQGVRVVTGVAARAITPDAGGVRVALDDAVLHARRVVVATGSAAARALLATPGIPVKSAPAVRVVAALIDSPALDAYPVGSGVIVAAGVPSAAKALTHSSAKWPWLAELLDSRRAAGSPHIVRLSARDADAPGLDTEADVAREVALLTGAPITEAAVRAVTSALWTDAVAAAPVDPDRRDELSRAGIDLAGAATAGTGLASVVPHARALARDVVARLAATPVLDGQSLWRNP